MEILVIGGTRFFGVPMVYELLERGHRVTIASRGLAQDDFGDRVGRIIMNRQDPEDIKRALTGKYFDLVIDKIAYCSNDVRNLLDVVDCGRYIYMSTTAVYPLLHMNTAEEEFDGSEKELIWCDRSEFPYDEVKRHAECALFQLYRERNWTAVRYPFVIGKDDYTNRLRFYVEHVMQEKPMFVDNPDSQLGFIRSDEAGRLIAFLADVDCTGPVNGCSAGTISVREVTAYVEEKTGKKAIFDSAGEEAPYNQCPSYSINTQKAQNLGFVFSDLHDWIYELLDHYIGLIKNDM